MEMTLTTPALLFPAISLLLLAYTNRYLTIAGLIRDLCDRYRNDKYVTGQIENLRRRIYLIRNMQILGVTAFFLCVVSMLFLFFSLTLFGEISFAASLICLLFSLALSLREISISVGALDLQLHSCED